MRPTCHLHRHPEDWAQGYYAPETQLLTGVAQSCSHTFNWEFSSVFKSTQCNGLIVLKGSLCSISSSPLSVPATSFSIQKPQQFAAMLTGSGCFLNNGTSIVLRDEITEGTSEFSLLWAQHFSCVGRISYLMTCLRPQGYEDDYVVNTEIDLLVIWWNHTCSLKREGVLKNQSFYFLKIRRNFAFCHYVKL